ncbi:hypothetical protein KC336_g5755 [Hortaea werneckii]|nr:hypothetical protein KC336_g5755 [Hortaea werneckii]
MPTITDLPPDTLAAIATYAFARHDKIRLGARGRSSWPEASDPPPGIHLLLHRTDNIRNAEFNSFMTTCVRTYASRNTFVFGMITATPLQVPIEVGRLRQALLSHFGIAHIPFLRDIEIRRPVAGFSIDTTVNYGWDMTLDFRQQIATLPFHETCELLFRLQTLNKSTIVLTGCDNAGVLVSFNKRVVKTEEYELVLFYMRDIVANIPTPYVIWRKGLPA